MPLPQTASDRRSASAAVWDIPTSASPRTDCHRPASCQGYFQLCRTCRTAFRNGHSKAPTHRSSSANPELSCLPAESPCRSDLRGGCVRESPSVESATFGHSSERLRPRRRCREGSSPNCGLAALSDLHCCGTSASPARAAETDQAERHNGVRPERMPVGNRLPCHARDRVRSRRHQGLLSPVHRREWTRSIPVQ